MLGAGHVLGGLATVTQCGSHIHLQPVAMAVLDHPDLEGPLLQAQNRHCGGFSWSVQKAFYVVKRWQGQSD